MSSSSSSPAEALYQCSACCAHSAIPEATAPKHVKSNIYKDLASLKERIAIAAQRASDSYQKTIQSFSQYLFKKGFIIPHYIVGSLFSEPVTVMKSAYLQLRGWKGTWEKHGFFDASKAGLSKLEAALKEHARTNPGVVPLPPVLNWHGVHSDPSVFVPWAPQLAAAQQSGKIGFVITQQLPNDMIERMQVCRDTIKALAHIYRKVYAETDVYNNSSPQVDIIGHSLGGYSGHLSAFTENVIYDPDTIGKRPSDKKNVQRRWHNIGERNPLVRKVISVAAPTWLCCQGQRDGTHWDIYPEKNEYSSEHKETIQAHHANIYDFVATQDAISETYSPLPQEQVFSFKERHLGIIHSPTVCRQALEILSS